MSKTSPAEEIRLTDKRYLGAVFTPLQWARFAVRKYGLLESWLAGKSILDPTMGKGHLLEALICEALEQGIKGEDLPISTIGGIEKEGEFICAFLERMSRRYELELDAANFTCADLFDVNKKEQYDIIFGNPPWCNFNDLPNKNKKKYKQLFRDYDLIQDPRKLLLGDSRIELAALFIQKSIADFLKPKGRAVFFIPLSLFLNDGANRAFRQYEVAGQAFAIKSILDLEGNKAFHDISTRNGIVEIQNGQKNKYPIDYLELKNDLWLSQKVAPIFHKQDALSVLGKNKILRIDFPEIKISKSATPRQGINTSGANHLFFFDELEHIQEGLVKLSNKKIQGAILPATFVHALMTRTNFEGEKEARKYVLLPYESTGKPISQKKMESIPHLNRYFEKHKHKLISRKGLMIQSWVRRGIYWALLGVGPYNFKSYKIVWEAYGKCTFNPIIVSGEWQMNQALQCYMPFQTKKEAKLVLKQLKNPIVEQYLLSHKMAGTMNWAQPGKIKKLLSIEK